MISFAIASGAGWLAVARADSPSTVARAASSSEVPIAAAIASDGTVATPSDGTWASRKVDVGRYELAFRREVALEIRGWDVPAGVTVEPLPHDRWLVTFVADEGPVDTAFTFRAAPVDSPGDEPVLAD